MSKDTKSSILFEMTPFRRILIVLLIVTEYVLFFWGITLQTRYLLGFNIPYVDYPTLADENVPSPNEKTHYYHLWNAALYLSFWVQHIMMASLTYKIKLQKWGKAYPLYQRYIYNIASGLSLWVIYANAQPRSQFLFEIPIVIWLPLSIIGIVLYVGSMIELGESIMMPFKLSSILSEKTVSMTPYTHTFKDGLYTKGLYGWMRNPMQTGLLLIIVFSNGHYTVDKLIFSAVMGAGIYIGVLLEEKRMLKQYETYKEYMGKVKTRLLPFLL